MLDTSSTIESDYDQDIITSTGVNLGSIYDRSCGMEASTSGRMARQDGGIPAPAPPTTRSSGTTSPGQASAAPPGPPYRLPGFGRPPTALPGPPMSSPRTPTGPSHPGVTAACEAADPDQEGPPGGARPADMVQADLWCRALVTEVDPSRRSGTNLTGRSPQSRPSGANSPSRYP